MTLSKRAKLNVIDYIVIYTFIFNIYLSLDFFDTGFYTDNIAFLKYASILFIIPVYIIYIFFKKNIFIDIRIILLSIFMLEVLLGSGYTIFIYGNSLEESFLGRGLIMTSVLVFYHYFRNISSEKLYIFFSILKSHLKIVGLSMSLIMILYVIGVLDFFGLKHIYHEEIFIILASSIFFYTLYLEKQQQNMFLISILFLLMGLFAWKNISFILMFVNLTFGIMLLNIKYTKNLHIKSLKILISLSIIFFIVFLTIYLYLNYYELLPSGSPDVRLKTYMQRYDEFLDSPIYGTMFIGTPIIVVEWLSIPSHSDFLDIMAFGGIISITMFLYINFTVVKSYLKFNYKMPNYLNVLYAFMAFVVIDFFLIMLFNPVWNQPRLGLLYWAAVGYVLAINVRCRKIKESKC